MTIEDWRSQPDRILGSDPNEQNSEMKYNL
jgi:hypothetical protein